MLNQNKPLWPWLLLSIVLMLGGAVAGLYESGTADRGRTLPEIVAEAETGTVEYDDWDLDDNEYVGIDTIVITSRSSDIALYDSLREGSPAVDVDLDDSLFSAVSVKQMNNILTITEKPGLLPAPGGENRDIILWLPDNFAGTIKASSETGYITPLDPIFPEADFELRSVSGSVTALECEARSITISTESGSVYVSETRTEELSVSSVSGDVSVYTAQPAVATLRTESGYLYLNEVVTDETLAATVSGYLSADEVTAGSLALNTESGKVYAAGVNTDRFAAATVSGDVSLSLMGQPDEYRLTLDTNSGAVNGLPSGGTGPRSFSVTTDSGDIYVQMETEETE